MVLAEAAKQAVWLRQLFNNIGKKITAPVKLLEDNQGAIKLANNPQNHPKSKHIAVRFHAIRDHVENGDVALEYTPTDTQAADCLTKAAEKNIHDRFLRNINLDRL